MGIVVCVVASSASLASASTHDGFHDHFANETSPWLIWNSPVAHESFSRISQDVVPSNLTRALYWSTSWYWDGPAPNGAYAGFQTGDYDGRGKLSGQAIFSIWDATNAVSAPGATCAPFGGEGIGMHCLAPMTVVATHRYRTIIKTDHVANGKQWWAGSVTDVTTGKITKLGTIEEPYAFMAVMPQSFLEYYGPEVTCAQTPYVVAAFDAPVVTPAGKSNGKAGTFAEGLGGGCPQSTFTPTATGASVTTGGPKPFMPFLFTPTIEPHAVKLKWLVSSDGGSPVLSQSIQASVNGGAWTQIAKAPALATVRTVQLAPGDYSFRIAATNSAGRGAWSEPSPIVTIT